ncbi:Pcmt1 [Symbiodinium natans]|uniref:protein-L-isoaspartate(D-aspartate) O-methyltransferase n=1 Tax=Symbiodinium natans TaxID=878477 RepID=A0A812R6P5_9DINO|nr:Pcmt1 [Symbiodinium natans]
MGSRAPSAEAAEEIPVCRFCGVPLSTADSHEELTQLLQRHGVLRSAAAAEAYAAVDRADFVPEGADAYLDAAAVMGSTGAQVSAPHVHAAALELVEEKVSGIEEPLRILDLGSGSGCMAAMLANLARGRGRVLGLEHIQELADESVVNVAKNHKDLLTDGTLDLRCQDARTLQEEGGFHVVHCGAALSGPEPWLLELLRPGGRAVAPIGATDAPQWLSSIDLPTDGGSAVVNRHLRVLYVPMTSEEDQRARGAAWEEVVARCVRNSAHLPPLAVPKLPE